MDWSNYGRGLGKWNIDHSVPISAFNLLDENQVMVCFSWKNLRPMWFEENRAKGDKILKWS